MLDKAPNDDDTIHLVSFPRADAVALSVELIQDPERMVALAPAWRELCARAVGPCFFQSPAWCLHVLQEMALSSSINFYEPIVATVRRGPKLVAVWPLCLRRKNGLRILTSLAAPFDQYADMLCDEGEVATEIAKLISASLKVAVRADGMILRKVRATSALRALVQEGGTIVDEGSCAPQISFDPGVAFSEYLSGISTKTRKNIRNYHNRLKRDGHLEHKVLIGSDIAAALRRSFAVRRKWLADTGQSSAAFRDTDFEQVICKLSENDAFDLGLIAFALTFNDEMIAIQWGFIHQGCYHAYLSSRDPEFERYSVGRIHLQMILEECHKRGVSAVDLMVPDVPYKRSWATSADGVADVIWSWSARGYLTMKIYDQNLRPLLKRLVQRLPNSLRQRLLSSFNAPHTSSPLLTQSAAP